MKCFLVVPIFDAPGSIEPDRGWDPQGRAILGWQNPATGERKEHAHMFGPGAMFSAIWQPKNWDWTNETEPHLNVVTPDGRTWDIDSRCSNCTLPEDKTHRCWVRHGEPPFITVDKNGLTCQAGGGSIDMTQGGTRPGFHGFLRAGEFT